MATSLWRRVLAKAIPQAMTGVDQELLDDLEESLLAADFGVDPSMRLVARVEEEAVRGRVRDASQLRRLLADSIRQVLQERPLGEHVEQMGDEGLCRAQDAPTVILLAGVNGVGKTTTIGKLAHRLVRAGERVMVAAADTYRAGAVEQLDQWARRAGADIVGGRRGADPASVAHDAVTAAVARDIDVLLIDTAGRLHTHAGLMREVAKVERVIGRCHPGAPHEALLVLDATVGQNGLVQAREFSKFIRLTGIVLAKLDSTARGGIVVALTAELGIPVRLVGLGEAPEDLRRFCIDDFVRGLLEESPEQ